MKKIELDLSNCYGIKRLKADIDFEGKNRFIGIYSPNGMMKTSLANTFLRVEREEDVPKDIYGNDAKRIISVDGRDINREDVLVVESFDNKIESLEVEDSSALLLNDDLKKEYDKLLAEEKEKRGEMLVDIKKKSGLSEDEFCKEVEEVFKSTFEEAVKRCVNGATSVEDNDPLMGIKYKNFFNSYLEQFRDSDEVREKFEEYHEKVNTIKFFNDEFNPEGFYAVKESLKKNNFFSNNKNKVVIGDGKEEEEFKTAEEMEEFVKKRISIAAEPIIKILNKNKGTRDIGRYLGANPGFVSRLDDIEKFKKDTLLAYLSGRQEQCSAFLGIIERNKEKILNIKKKAYGEETIWEYVLKIFKNRFSVPFNIVIKDKSLAVLGGGQVKSFGFEIKRGDENVTKDDVQDLRFLSAGEKKALYILRTLFAIEKKKQESDGGKEFLIIFDDIVDSFDYKNKYAFLQYLKDIKDKEKQIYCIVLTHNFDFFRNLVRKGILKRDFENKFIAMSKDGVVSVSKFDPHIIQNAFYKLASGGSIASVEIVACIPFLRTLLEMQEKKAFPEYESLTGMLHINKYSNDQTLSKLGEVYEKILDKKIEINKSDLNKKVREYIKEVINKEVKDTDIKESEIYKKVCLSVGVRLLAEEMCIERLNMETSKITNSEKIFSDFLKNEGVQQDEKELIKGVSMGTPDYIHSNSFMYEPLIDQSVDGLLSLYNELEEKVDVGADNKE